jgi:hypothetical protein
MQGSHDREQVTVCCALLVDHQAQVSEQPQTFFLFARLLGLMCHTGHMCVPAVAALPPAAVPVCCAPPH